jgi:hypothetical protein
MIDVGLMITENISSSPYRSNGKLHIVTDGRPPSYCDIFVTNNKRKIKLIIALGSKRFV